MITSDISDLIHLRLSEPDARELLSSLTPDQVDTPLFAEIVKVLRATNECPLTVAEPFLDCCGTGGSGIPHFNVSTTTAFVLAAGGVKVVKFGNRAITSQSGSFDMLEQLGIPAVVSFHHTRAIFESTGLAFLFAPQCYPALRAFTVLRKTIGVRTIFNFVGPLLHPLNPAYRLMGVSHPKMQSHVARVLSQDQTNHRSLIVCGEEKLDELTPFGSNRCFDVFQGVAQEMKLSPVNTLRSSHPELRYTVGENLLLFQKMIAGKLATTPEHQFVCFNAGAGFFTAGVTSSIEEGTHLARELLATGRVKTLVTQVTTAYAHHAQ